MTGWTVLAGCGKTTLARENFEGPHVWYNSRTLPQDAQKGRSARPQASRNRRRYRPHFVGPFARTMILANGKTHPALPTSENLNRYVEDFGEPRTTLADFFSILLEGGQRLMTISRATLPLGPKGF